MKRLAVAILLLGGMAWGQAPTPIKVKAGKVAVLTSKAAGEVAWVWDRRYLPEDQTYHDRAQKTLVITSGTNATFLVTAVEHVPSKGFTQTEYLVTFEGSPAPPVPPGPDPPQPPPDTLESRMLKAYQLDKAAGKAKDSELRLTEEIFKAADQFFGVITSTGTLYQVLDLGLSTAAPGGMPQMKLVIDAHLAKVAPRGKDVPLTDALKAAFKTAFGELAKAVEACLAPQPPPGPDPPPGPAPIPEAGLRVLIVYESGSVTPAQNLVISGAEVRGYVAGKSGKFRAYDQNTPLVNEEEWVKLGWKRERKSVPWLIVSNHPRGGHEGPLPATIQDTMKLLKQWGDLP